MTITNPSSGQVATATAATAVFTTASTLAGGTPTTGDVVIGILDRSADNGAVTTPAGWLPLVEAASGAVTVTGHVGIYYKIIDGLENLTYTWNFTSSSRKMGFLQFHQDQPGRLWTPDSGNTDTFAGSNTTRTSLTPAQGAPETGTLTDAEEIIVAGLVLQGSTGTITPTASGLTVIFGANVTQIMAATITAVNTAVAPTWAWATSRAQSAGAIAAMRSVPIAGNGNMLSVF